MICFKNFTDKFIQFIQFRHHEMGVSFFSTQYIVIYKWPYRHNVVFVHFAFTKKNKQAEILNLPVLLPYSPLFSYAFYSNDYFPLPLPWEYCTSEPDAIAIIARLAQLLLLSPVLRFWMYPHYISHFCYHLNLKYCHFTIGWFLVLIVKLVKSYPWDCQGMATCAVYRELLS